MSKHYTLRINAYTPETIPMARLARYMQRLAAMLGHDHAVHFVRVDRGSTQIVTRIDHEDGPKVASHLARIKRGEGSPEADKAQAEINRWLEEDHAEGCIYEGEDENAKVIDFQGANRPKPITHGPFNQEGSIDGELISVGGADATVHLQLQSGEVKDTGIETDRDTALRIARHIYEQLRIFGIGRWLRDREGNWVLKKFRVDRFDVLENDDLKDVIDRMREIEGSGWKRMDDPIGVLQDLREKGDGLR